MSATIRLQREPFDAAAEAAKLTRGRTDIGAVVTFTGICRGDENGRPLAAMTLEHYPDMAEAEIARHVEAAQRRWPLLGVTVIHRFGRLTPGEDIVLVVAARSHRQDAFAAAEFLMDYLKTRAPFWKQVEYARRQDRPRAGREDLGRRQAGRRRARPIAGPGRRAGARRRNDRRIRSSILADPLGSVSCGARMQRHDPHVDRGCGAGACRPPRRRRR